MQRKSGTKKKISAKHQRIILAAVTAIMCMLVLVSAFLIFRSFLTVKEFVLSGVSQYDTATIAGCSGIKKGDRIYSVNFEKAEKQIIDACPYVETVEIEIKFPNTVIFNVSERTPMWYVEIAGDYYVLDYELVVIEETVTNEKLVNGEVTELKLPNIKSAISGDALDFGNDETEKTKILQFLANIRAEAMRSRMSCIDVRSRFDVTVIIDGRFELYMGDTSNVSSKIAAYRELWQKGKLDEFASAEIDVSTPESISVRPTYKTE